MKTILVVDDNLVSLKQICSQLTKTYEVTLAKSGGQALQICERQKPDLILLDVEMPDMDGHATIALIKGDPELDNIPVIFLTGNSDAGTEALCRAAGAVDFITKPADAVILQQRIQEYIST